MDVEKKAWLSFAEVVLKFLVNTKDCKADI